MQYIGNDKRVKPQDKARRGCRMKRDYIKDTKRILRDYPCLISEYSLKARELENIRSNDGLRGVTHSIAQSQNNSISSKVECIGEKNIEHEQEILREFNKLEVEVLRIEKALNELEEIERQVIELKYFKCKNWGYVADAVHYSEIHTKRIGKDAVTKICTSLFGIKSFTNLPLFKYLESKK